MKGEKENTISPTHSSVCEHIRMRKEVTVLANVTEVFLDTCKELLWGQQNDGEF